jgi:hypothetical protein
MIDEQAEGGRVVPAYALTHGRTRSAVGQDLPLETLVTATDLGRQRSSALRAERRTILEFCAAPMSVAEVAARLAIPIGVARVLVTDLACCGYLAVHLPPGSGDGQPDAAILARLLNGLRAR